MASLDTDHPDDFEPNDEGDFLPDAAEDESEGDVKHFRFRVSKNLTRRVDQYLTDRVSHLSRAAVQRLIDEGMVKVNGRVIKASYHPRAGDIVQMVAPPQPVTELVPEPIPLDIIYEDELFLALNKQAGLIVHPARGRWTGTLVNGLAYYGQKWSTVNGAWRPGILHRLDRNTTGVMLVAKSDEAHWRLARQFENRTIQKTYLAVVHGVPPLLADVIDMPIGRDRYVREKQAVRKVEHGGRQAITKYEVLDIFEQAVTAGQGSGRFALLQLSPKTGRTHQLRVHLSTRGYPIVGDTVYGGRVFEAGAFRLERQALHAYEITFVHPGTFQQMTLQAPLPGDLATLLQILRSGRV
ncbi:MAG: RluA family pseudouridine synthase [Planctomycetota bacterium]|nr:RluA family pseudouridine synthase [Planctomycetota bacterium]